MDKLIAQFPKQIADALEIAQSALLESLDGARFENVVICGMGGSGIGGQMVSQWFADTANVPITRVQSYKIPGFVNSKTLVIGSSYSGNTEETLEAINAAHKAGATIVGVGSGGTLHKFCQQHHYDFIRVPGGNPPRSMLAFSVVQLVQILSSAGIIAKESIKSINNCRHLLNEELITIKKEARKLAEHVFKKQCILYGNTSLESVVVRARQQFNENSKQLCWHHVIPEMNHNELVGWGGGLPNMAPVFFESQFLTERNQLRFKLSKEIIGEKTQHIFTVQGKGKNPIEESFFFIHLVDWASLYLAELNNVDPVEIRVIDYLKSSLSKA